MSLNTLIKAGITTLLGGPIIEILVEKASQKAVTIFKEKFTFTAFEIAKTYQQSYDYALAAISAGLVEPEEQTKFLQTLTHSKVSREFAAQIEQDYLQPFASIKQLSPPKLRVQFIEQIQQLVQQPPIFTAENRRFTEPELAAFIKDDGALAITDLILAQCSLDETLEAFFRHQDLLGKATLFFFRELLHNDVRAKTTLETLQREHLLVKVDELKTSQVQVLKQLQQQLSQQKTDAKQALDAGDFSQAHQMMEQMQGLQKTINTVPQRLQSAVSNWQSNHQAFLEFSHQFSNWTRLLDSKVDQVLEAVGSLGDIDNNVKSLLEEFRAFKRRFDLSTQIKPRDEFTRHTPSSSAEIQQALAKLKRLPVQNYQLSILAGAVVSSSGEIAEAEKLFVQARDGARNSAEKALASFNLFQIRLRRQAYSDALADLKSAIANDSSYALHNISRYPMKQLLGAGGMGCVFLCRDVDENNKLVAVKCFWEGRKGERQQVFKEAILMRDIAGDYVPKPLHWDYADAIREEKPYFVAEYIEGALDGEAWIAKYGKLDVSTGIELGIEIAKALQLAHENQIFHLDLKPANLLLKRSKTGISVKIIDFGLARVAGSLRDGVRSATGKTQFGQTIIGTLYYAPPEQLGHLEYGEPGAKSDLYAFGGSLYRLMTGEVPQPLNPDCLRGAPPALFQLLCQCLNRVPEQRPESARQLVRKLEEIRAAVQKPQSQSAVREKPGSFLGVFYVGFVVVVAAVAIWLNNNRVKTPEYRPVANPLSSSIEQEQDTQEERIVSELIAERAAEIFSDKQNVFRDPFLDGSGFGPKMVWIPAGSFRMGDIQGGGDSDEKPVHEVWVDGFAMGMYEVTFDEYDKFAEATGREKPNDRGWGRGSRPVINVSWEDTTAYAEWLSDQTGKQYRLPTEAEWEYAARAGTDTKYWWGNEIDETKANYGYKLGRTSPVGSFEANHFGLYDTAGNVWEWTCSEYEKPYQGKEKQCVTTASSLSLRGGSWTSLAWCVRSAFRYWNTPPYRYGLSGFRVSRL